MAFGLSQYDLLTIAEEVTNGTFVQPTATDFNLLFHDIGKPTIDWGYTSIGKRSDNTQNEGHEVVGRQSVALSGVKFPFYFSGVSTAPGALEKLLLSSGFKSVAGTPHKYTYDGTMGCETFSAAFQGQDCTPTYKQLAVAGCTANLQFGAESVGAPTIGTFDLLGSLESYETPLTPITNTDLQAGTISVSLPFLDAPVTIDGTEFICKSFNVAMNATQALRTSSSEEGGVINSYFNGFKPELTMVLEDFTESGLFADNKANTIFTSNTNISLENFNINVIEANINDWQKTDMDGLECVIVKFHMRKFELERK
jgi:hypothetical protein